MNLYLFKMNRASGMNSVPWHGVPQISYALCKEPLFFVPSLSLEL